MTCSTCAPMDCSCPWDMTVGDLTPALSGYLKNGDGSRPDLTGSTLRIKIIDSAGTVIQAAGVVVVDDPILATWHYPWVTGDTDAPGMLRARIRVVYPSTKPETFPSGGRWFYIRVGA